MSSLRPGTSSGRGERSQKSTLTTSTTQPPPTTISSTPPAAAPQLPEHHKSDLRSLADSSAKQISHHKKHTIKIPHHFSSTGAGIPAKMKHAIKKGLHLSSPSTSPSTSSPISSSAGNTFEGEGAISDGDGDGEETGYDGVKESEGGGKEGGKKEEKGKAHIGRHGSFGHVSGGAGMPGKMKERLSK